jgi:hypothetical protein
MNQFKELRWQTSCRGNIERQRIFPPVANLTVADKAAACICIVHFEMKQRDADKFEADP